MERTIKTQPFRATNCEHAFAIENEWMWLVVRIHTWSKRRTAEEDEEKQRDQFYNRSNELNENDKRAYTVWQCGVRCAVVQTQCLNHNTVLMKFKYFVIISRT